jgi:tripartite-type tricarboxylate transporter receptor subunit TctC
MGRKLMVKTRRGKITWRVAGATALAFALLGSAPASAQLPQNQPVRIVLGLAPGGATDVGARVVGKEYTEQTGQQVVIENRAGGGGALGAMAVKTAAPDGLTLALMDNGACCANTVLTNVAYDTLRDFKPVLLLWSYPTILLVPEDSPVKSVADLVALGRSRPEGLTYASQGVGGGGHILGAMLGRIAKIQVVHVPYRGATPAATDLAAGRADFLFASYASVNPFISSHRIRAIATRRATTPCRATARCRPWRKPDSPTCGSMPGSPCTRRRRRRRQSCSNCMTASPRRCALLRSCSGCPASTCRSRWIRLRPISVPRSRMRSRACARSWST